MEYGAPLSGGKGLVKGVPSERRGPPFGGLGGLAPARGLFPQGCAPHFLFETSKRKCAAPGGKEKMFGGSVCAGADLLPPAGDGWHFLVEVRDGNVRPLGKPLARGGLGYMLRRFSLPLAGGR